MMRVVPCPLALAFVLSPVACSSVSPPRGRRYFDHTTPRETVMAFLYAVENWQWTFASDLIVSDDVVPLEELSALPGAIELAFADLNARQSREIVSEGHRLVPEGAMCQFANNGVEISLHLRLLERVEGVPLWYVSWSECSVERQATSRE